MLTDTRNSKNAKVYPLPANAIQWTGGIWKERSATCYDSTVFQLKRMFDDKDISHVVENFKICAGEVEGDFDGTVFGDGDFYKWMEAATYSAVKRNDNELLQMIDDYIELIGKAQQEDGYLSTKQIIGERQGNGIKRMGDIDDFEVYNFGHMFTSACYHKRLTGKDNFFKIAEKTASYLQKLYKEAEEKGEVQTAVCPSHYMGLVEMYRETRDTKYLVLANKAIELRDSVSDGMDDNQDRIPLKEHNKIIGHAVRANYLYAGVADICLEEDNKEYKEVLDKVWRNLIDKKIYITGGTGALYNGTSPYGNFFMDQKIHQAYGYEYQLPNITAYNETCASIGAVLWAYRMFQLEPKAEYFDVIERIMLNTNLASLSLDGKRFFYENMLRRTKKLDYELIWPLTRTEYILSYCCPPNIARNIAQCSEYAYLQDKESVWVGLYGENRASFKLENGAEFDLEQSTNYPFNGEVRFDFTNVKNDRPIKLMLRIPSWVKSGEISVNNRNNRIKHMSGSYISEDDRGIYYEAKIDKIDGSEIQINFDMPVRYTVANPMVEETVNQIAVEKGPIVYCGESVDNNIDTLDNLLFDINAKFTEEDIEIEGRKIPSLVSEQYKKNVGNYADGNLYNELSFEGVTKEKIRLIPYYAWDNRSFGEMRIWFPVGYNLVCL